MPRLFYFAGIFCLFAAFLFSLLASVSSAQNLDFVRIKIEETTLHLGICTKLHRDACFFIEDEKLGCLAPVTVVTAFAFGLFFVKHEKRRIISSLSAFVALFWTAIAFIIDFALYNQVASAMGKITSNGEKRSTSGGPVMAKDMQKLSRA
ncbi:hypothetical protein C8J57DRAFT_1230977 [Mycena rebaudengoi]|nr:hypothetical protein C8J57DRAFT_1230977 [Mycena rebaudengoi]